MVGLFLSAGIPATPVQAAGISYQKAVRMYNNKLSYWGRKGTRLNINYDLRSRSGWKYNDCGKTISMKTVYDDDNLRYIFRDVNGDNLQRKGAAGCDHAYFLFWAAETSLQQKR